MVEKFVDNMFNFFHKKGKWGSLEINICYVWYYMCCILDNTWKTACFEIGCSWIELLNILRPRQNGRHFADDIFKYIFLNENVWIPIKISLKFVPKGRINNIPALVQIMAWRRPGDKPLSEPMMVSLHTHICVTRPQLIKIKYVKLIDWWLNTTLWYPQCIYCGDIASCIKPSRYYSIVTTSPVYWYCMPVKHVALPGVLMWTYHVCRYCTCCGCVTKEFLLTFQECTAKLSCHHSCYAGDAEVLHYRPPIWSDCSLICNI